MLSCSQPKRRSSPIRSLRMHRPLGSNNRPPSRPARPHRLCAVTWPLRACLCLHRHPLQRRQRRRRRPPLCSPNAEDGLRSMHRQLRHRAADRSRLLLLLHLLFRPLRAVRRRLVARAVAAALLQLPVNPPQLRSLPLSLPRVRLCPCPPPPSLLLLLPPRLHLRLRRPPLLPSCRASIAWRTRWSATGADRNADDAKSKGWRVHTRSKKQWRLRRSSSR